MSIIIDNLGEEGIRTLGTEKPHNRLAICRLQPLGHLSMQKKRQPMTKPWLKRDLNLRPWAYESPALTTELLSHLCMQNNNNRSEIESLPNNKKNNINTFYMPTFWENVLQLARFFISSVAGLIFIIISPFIALKKQPFFISLVIGGSVLLLVSTYQILQAMLGIKEAANIL